MKSGKQRGLRDPCCGEAPVGLSSRVLSTKRPAALVAVLSPVQQCTIQHQNPRGLQRAGVSARASVEAPRGRYGRVFRRECVREQGGESRSDVLHRGRR